MIRLLFLGIALYLAARILGGLFKTPEKRVEVKGDSKKTSLDLSDEEIEDIDFKEIK